MENDENIKSFTIKVYPSEEERFRKLVSKMDDIETLRGGLLRLMDKYENPKTVIKDNPELIKKNEELGVENEELKKKIEELTNSGNESAMSAQKIQLELEAAQEENARLKEEAANRSQEKENRPENVFLCEVHPVPFYFLKKMAEHISKEKKTEITPAYVLTDLFLKDLQNPRSNNLPYIVSTSEIEKVLNEYKKAHPEEYQKN